jgi:hypothetical protein
LAPTAALFTLTRQRPTCCVFIAHGTCFAIPVKKGLRTSSVANIFSGMVGGAHENIAYVLRNMCSRFVI